LNPQDLCPECGSDRRSGSFCDVCGAVLDWTRPTAPVAAETRPLTPSAPETRPLAADRPSGGGSAASPPAEGHGGERPRSDERSHGDEADDQDQAAAEADTRPIGGGAGPRAAAVADAMAADGPERGEPGSATGAPADHATERARQLLVPVAETKQREPLEPEVAPVLPGRPRQARPQVRVAESEVITGGVLCPWCDTANPRDRRFCRQCAMSLVTAEERQTRTRSWWRRVIDRNGREAPWAGERPRLRRGVGRLVVRVVAAVAAIGLVVAVVTYLGPAVNAVRDHFAKRVPVIPDGSRASHSDPNNGPAKAFDGLSDTYWGDGYRGPGFGQFVEATFTQPQRLLNVIITPGISTRPDLYATQGRPQILEATVFSAGGDSATRSLQLDDTAGPQKFRLNGADVVRVRLTIRAAFGATIDRQVAITEVEFFARTARKN
jgi:hypothetical protein